VAKMHAVFSMGGCAMKRNQIARVHSFLPDFKKRVEQARSVVLDAIAKDVPFYVSLSGGKDSRVVLDLVMEHESGVMAAWSDNEFFLPETEEYIHRLREAGINVHQFRTNAWHASWFDLKGSEYDSIHDYPKSKIDAELIFLGLRKEESSARRKHLARYGPLYWNKKWEAWYCNPIWDWTWQDVWAYIVSKDLDYNKAYDKLEELGLHPKEQRIGPFAVERALWSGQLQILKRGWPDMFERFAQKYPEARAYV